MNRKDLMTLRRRVRRDDNLSDGAVRLFGEILDLHMLDGCFAKDKTLATWMGTSTRTIRRRRDELMSAGYLNQTHRDGRRHLVPQEPAGREETPQSDNPDRTKVANRTNLSGQNCPPPDKTGHDQPDKSGQHREISITPVGAESESAHAREAGPEVSVSSSDPVEIYRQVTNCSCPMYYRDKIQHKIPNRSQALALWEAVCMRWAEASKDPDRRWDPRKVPNLLDAYEQESEQLTHEQPDDPFADNVQRIRRAAGLA